MQRLADVKFNPTEPHFVLGTESAHLQLLESKTRAHLNSKTFGPPGFLNVAKAISLDPLSIFPS